ERGSHDRDDEV
ncbi:hypothetical protein A2U01_0069733, partial [Trifolium medium]|nr:hypothetical protein [Trifolium medium]